MNVWIAWAIAMLIILLIEIPELLVIALGLLMLMGAAWILIH